MCLIDGAFKLPQACSKRFFWSAKNTTRQHCYGEVFLAREHWNWLIQKQVQMSDSTYKYFESWGHTPFLLCCYNLSFIWDLQCWVYNDWSGSLIPATCNPRIIIKKKERLRINYHRILKSYAYSFQPILLVCSMKLRSLGMYEKIWRMSDKYEDNNINISFSNWWGQSVRWQSNSNNCCATNQYIGWRLVTFYFEKQCIDNRYWWP